MNWLLRVYDYFYSHRLWLWGGVAILLLLIVVGACSLRYHENIIDFLPATNEERAAFEQISSQQSASRLVLIIEGDSLCEQAMDKCVERIPNLQTELDLEEWVTTSHWPITSIPDSVYDCLDSLLTPDVIHHALERDQLILSTPGTSFLLPIIRHDPLGLSQWPLGNSTQPSNNRVFAFYDSQYGATETKHNAVLVDSLVAVTDQISEQYPSLNIRWTGAPIIAVGNARRIKIDTVLCVALALVFIIVLLLYAFPRKRDILLIMLAVTFGWIFGMAVLRLVTSTVSVIVLGIGSILIGIAVNYPLHLLVHQRYASSVRQTLQEVLSPLVIGNITTVGAFLSLVPLHATALHDLGVFAASMLVGTILFCVLVLPHLMCSSPTPIREIKVKSQWFGAKERLIGGWSVLAMTVLMGGYVLANGQWKDNSLFDSNMSHVNYMTDQQRADMAMFEMNHSDGSRWYDYWQTHDPQVVIKRIQKEATTLGYAQDAFQPFYDQLQLSRERKVINNNSQIINDLAQRLSDDFDYIGLCCSIIVFLFLWLSFRSVLLALIAFVPMLLSWLWILALMHILGLQFNIVNIILATFIFGQGDDYTIFVVEGLLYEHRTGKPIVAQYTQSILLSALIMLVGIGVLIFAVHPALHSLGAVTLIGMTTVVVTALTVPPVLFRLLTRFKLLPTKY